TFALGDDDRIRVLEQELYSLRKTKQVFDGVYMPPRKSNTNTRQSPPTSGSGVEKALPWADVSLGKNARLPVTVPTAASSTTPSTSQPIVTMPEADKEPEHPYRVARDATYMPPSTRNFASNAPRPQNRDPAYHTTTPVYQPRLSDDVFK
ncbi:uncharacterized protein LAESUDRAFT_604770, partial [Laetiporus sulphureus 93-53]